MNMCMDIFILYWRETMKILGSMVDLKSENNKTYFHSKTEKVEAKGSLSSPNSNDLLRLKDEVMKNPDNYMGEIYDKDGNRISNKAPNQSLKEALEKSDEKNIEENSKSRFEELSRKNNVEENRLPTIEEIKEKIIRSVVKALHRMLTGSENSYDDDMDDLREKMRELNSEIRFSNADSGRERTFRVSYEREEMVYTSETTKFQANGIVKTSDGREISLNLNFHSEHEMTFISRDKFTGEVTLKPQPPAIDPLVINIDEPYAGISEMTMDFDLDADGVMDNVSFVSKGSGFLAFDKNGDGKINDGSELFGTQSGNGFADLKKYDLDGNNWIDENDAIFDKLKIWTLGQDNVPKLLSLKNAGIGAIYLNNVKTDMTIENSIGDTRGYMRKSGIYLRENGQVNTIQHIDLVG